MLAAPDPSPAQVAPSPELTVAATTTRARADVGLRADVHSPAGTPPARTVTLTLPDGLLGRLTSVPFCEDAQARQGRCPPASRLGTSQLVVQTAGGTATLSGTLALAGPGDGALVRMVLSLPAASAVPGAGRLVRLAAVGLGERNGRISVRVTLPTAIRGVPVSVRRLSLDISRPGFLFNPSGCSGREVEAIVAGAGGVRRVTAPYPVTGCERLAFRPDLRLLSEDRRTRRRDSRPPLTIDLRPRASDAALRGMEIAFPRHLQPNIQLLQAVCNQDALAAGRCPPATRIATARATSPLIPGELEGPVTLVFPERPRDTGPGLELPTTAITLQGLGGLIKLRLDGRLRLDNGRLVSSFTALPDVPLTSFTFALRPGNLIATRSLCSPRFSRAQARITGHDGTVRSFRPAPSFAACARVPQARVTMERVRGTQPVVAATIEPPPRGPRMRRVVLTLPDALSVRRTRRGISVRAGGRRLARRHWSLSRRTKRLRITGGLSGRRGERVRIVLRDGAVVAGRRTRERARRGDLRLRFRLGVRDRAGKITTRRVSGYDEAWIAPRAAPSRRR
jgi:hypothetical protein